MRTSRAHTFCGLRDGHDIVLPITSDSSLYTVYIVGSKQRLYNFVLLRLLVKVENRKVEG